MLKLEYGSGEVFPYRCNQSLRIFLKRRFMPLDSLRRRGLAISSMPKFTKVSAAPKIAMHMPGGRNHHQAPRRRASLLEAENSILPQVVAVISPSPRYSRAVSARIT